MRTKKSLTHEANQRVAAARELEVASRPASLPRTVRGLFEKWNAAADAAFDASLETKGKFMRWVSSGSVPVTRHYFLLEQPKRLVVTFGTRAERVVEHGFNPTSHGWLARISPLGSRGGDRTRIEVALVKWSVNDDGLMWNGSAYVQLLDGLVTGLNGAFITVPVSEADHRFISQS